MDDQGTKNICPSLIKAKNENQKNKNQTQKFTIPCQVSGSEPIFRLRPTD